MPHAVLSQRVLDQRAQEPRRHEGRGEQGRHRHHRDAQPAAKVAGEDIYPPVREVGRVGQVAKKADGAVRECVARDERARRGDERDGGGQDGERVGRGVVLRDEDEGGEHGEQGGEREDVVGDRAQHGRGGGRGPVRLEHGEERADGKLVRAEREEEEGERGVARVEQHGGGERGGGDEQQQRGAERGPRGSGGD